MGEQNGILGRSGKWEKLENPARAAELDPAGTLRRAGLQSGQTLCDIGAGSGLFTLAAARLTDGTVWAAETDADILARLTARAQKEGLSNVLPVPAEGVRYRLPDGCADWALLVTVLHEIAEKDALLDELRRLLKPDGRVCLVEFQKARTPMGPPPEHRLGAGEAAALFPRHGFAPEQQFPLSENFYCQVWKKA